jgi:hypothetical protein
VSTFAQDLKERGFASEKEYWEMISTVRLPHQWQIDQFKEWRDRKGTKTELERIAKGDSEGGKEGHG